ncbi:uracil-DNA glycosylase [Bacillus suaedae]|uniref:Uracil-DNA glycosylase n=1 Tax=Halalkalibacter suaedae TaxID=2822140 RepID=A0A941APF7_9BACI|nr:uracil-DNA glycosylase [Bacillus suaedae]MBP3952735.1 uracil-DNA glycosylase [Bacillus suaedae]
MTLLPDQIHESWVPFLTKARQEEIAEIEQKIGDNYNPTDPSVILRFLTVNLDQVSVVWLGQDVYPMEGVATGRAFEVGGLASWNRPFRQVSLKNIIRLIHKTTNDIANYEEIKSFKEIQKELEEKRFSLAAPNKWFNKLEEQGVLFLNTSFTCEVGIPNSHKDIWANFSQAVLQYISNRNPNIIWFLWGKEAISNKQYIKAGIFYESRHPMMCSSKYPDDFLKFEGFKATKEKIDWLGNV